MNSITLHDGTEVEIDLNAITLKEWLGMFDKTESENTSDKTIAKACHMPYEKMLEISFEDYRRIVKVFFDKSREPLNDPN